MRTLPPKNSRLPSGNTNQLGEATMTFRAPFFPARLPASRPLRPGATLGQIPSVSPGAASCDGVCIVVRPVKIKAFSKLNRRRELLSTCQSKHKTFVQIVNRQLRQNIAAIDGGESMLPHAGFDERASLIRNKKPSNASKFSLLVLPNPMARSPLSDPPVMEEPLNLFFQIQRQSVGPRFVAFI